MAHQYSPQIDICRGSHVPHRNGTVLGACHHQPICKPQVKNCFTVVYEGVQHLAGLDVPNSGRGNEYVCYQYAYLLIMRITNDTVQKQLDVANVSNTARHIHDQHNIEPIVSLLCVHNNGHFKSTFAELVY